MELKSVVNFTKLLKKKKKKVTIIPETHVTFPIQWASYGRRYHCTVNTQISIYKKANKNGTEAKFIDTQSRKVVTSGWGEGKRGYNISVTQDE